MNVSVTLGGLIDELFSRGFNLRADPRWAVLLDDVVALEDEVARLRTIAGVVIDLASAQRTIAAVAGESSRRARAALQEADR